jgi:dihydroorotate dehydrogenase electron transfer subunit
MYVENGVIRKNEPVGREYRLLTLVLPNVAPDVRPGQFVHLRIPRLHDAVLRRPFSVFKTRGKTLSILYRTVGRGTRAMLDLRERDEISVVGPLGNGFPIPSGKTVLPVLVAGGYGVAPLYLLARNLPRKGVLFVGGAGKDDILCVRDFKQLGWPVHVATEDGSRGKKGFVTAALDGWLARRPAKATPEFYACGPNGMLKAVGERAVQGGWRAWLSLDRHMGCGVGACLACVQRVLRNGEEIWARVCTDGPVFEAREVVWEPEESSERR